MANKKNDPKGDSQSPGGNKFENHEKNKLPERPGQHAGDSRGSSSSGASVNDDDMTTAGGREGQFSDKERGEDNQWSPGSRSPVSE